MRMQYEDVIDFDEALEGITVPVNTASPLDSVYALWSAINSSANAWKAEGAVGFNYKVWMIPSPQHPELTSVYVEENVHMKVRLPIRDARGRETGRFQTVSQWKRQPGGENLFTAIVYAPPAVREPYWSAAQKKGTPKTITSEMLSKLMQQLVNDNRTYTGMRALLPARMRSTIATTRTTPTVAKAVTLPGVSFTPGASKPGAPAPRPVEAPRPPPGASPPAAGTFQRPSAALERIAPTLAAKIARVEVAKACPPRVRFPKSVEDKLAEIQRLLRQAEVQRMATSEHGFLKGDKFYRQEVLRKLATAQGCGPRGAVRISKRRLWGGR